MRCSTSFKPSPIVFFTLINLYLFICLFAILVYKLYTDCLTPRALAAQRKPSTRARRK